MAEWWETGLSWLSDNADTIINVGQGAYDIYNQQQTKSTLSGMTQPGGIVDPFGAQRPQYQQKLSQLYQNPSSLQNLPGYQFQQQMGEQAINRGAAKSGHFNAPNRLYELSKFNQGLAETSYNQEATRLAQLAGSGINPNAGAALTGVQGQQQLATASGTSAANTISGGPTGGGIMDLLKSFSSDSSTGEGGVGDLAGSITDWMDQEFDLGLGGLGDSWDTFNEEYLGGEGARLGNAAARIAAGEDPEEVLKDEATSYAKEEGGDYLKDLYKDWQAERSTDASLENLATSDAGVDSGYGADAPSPITGPEMAGGTGAYANSSVAEITSALTNAGIEATEATISMARSGGTLAEVANAGEAMSFSGQPMGAEFGANAPGAGTSMTGAATAVTGAGGALGGYIGGYLATKYIDDNPAVAGVGSALGAYAGAYAGAAAMGASTAAGTGAAAGTSAAGMAAGAVAGPLAIAAAVYVIGSGAYGLYTRANKKEEKRDSDMRTWGEWYGEISQGGLVDDPTGGGLGRGFDYTDDGHRFFVPEKFLKSQYNKNMYGEYTDESTVQRNFGSYYNPGEDAWYEGEFGTYSTTGDSTHNWTMGADTWTDLRSRKSWEDREPGMGGFGLMMGQYGSSYADAQLQFDAAREERAFQQQNPWGIGGVAPDKQTVGMEGETIPAGSYERQVGPEGAVSYQTSGGSVGGEGN